MHNWRKVLAWNVGTPWVNVSQEPYPDKLIGTHLVTEFDQTYDVLLRVFGEPDREFSPGDPTDVEWRLQHSETLAMIAIYNYKDGSNYQGAQGIPVEELSWWHVGGEDEDRDDIYQLIAWIKPQ